MPKRFRLATPLRKLTEGEEFVEVGGVTVGEALMELQSLHPAVTNRVFDENGDVRKYIAVYLNDEDIRGLNGRQTKLNEGDEISLEPAISGG